MNNLSKLEEELKRAKAHSNSFKAKANAHYAKHPPFGQANISRMQAAAARGNRQGAGINMAKINNMQRQLNNHMAEHQKIMSNWAEAYTKVANIEKKIRQLKGEPEPAPISYAMRFH